jgi:hypothetical protein
MSALLPYLLPLVKQVAPLVLSALTNHLKGSAKTFKERAKKTNRQPNLTSQKRVTVTRSYRKKKAPATKKKTPATKKKPKKRVKGGALRLAGGALGLAGGALRLAGQRHLMGNRRLTNLPMAY